MFSVRRWAVTVISWIESLPVSASAAVLAAVAARAVAADVLPRMTAIAYDNVEFTLHPLF